MGLDAGWFLACASAIMLRVAFAPLLRLALRHRPFHLGAGFRLVLLRLRQLLGELSKLLFQGGIFRLQRGNCCLQLVNALDGFFKGWWHGVSIPQFHPPKCEQLRNFADLTNIIYNRRMYTQVEAEQMGKENDL
jgi:hypothetical protein